MNAEITKDYSRGLMHIYLYQDRGDSTIYFNPDENGSLIQTKVPAGQYNSNIKPILVLPLRFSDGVLKAIVDELEATGIQTEKQSTIAGKYEAQSEHLKDLQVITKKLLKLD